MLLLPAIGEKLAVVGDLDAGTRFGLHLFYVHVEGYGTHDAVAELLVDKGFDGGAVDLGNLVYPVDGGIGGYILVEGSAHRDLSQGPGDLGIQAQ